MNAEKERKLHASLYKVDIHTHLGADDKGRELFSVQDRLKFDRLLGIGHSVILPYPTSGASPDDGRRATAQAREAARTDPEHFSWFCSVYPDGTFQTRALLEEYRAQGAVGVGELGFMLPFDDPRMDHLLACCGDLGLPVLFHLSPMGSGSYGVIDGPGLPRLEKALASHPNTVLIAHSQPFWYESCKQKSIDEIKKVPQILRG